MRLHFHIKDACDPPLMGRYYLFHHCPLIGSVPRASISRDPFYDMLATRKRRIANKKWKETICSFFTSTASLFSLLHEHLGDKVLLLPWAGCWGDLTHRWGNSRPPGHSHLAHTNNEPAHSLYLPSHSPSFSRWSTTAVFQTSMKYQYVCVRLCRGVHAVIASTVWVQKSYKTSNDFI